METRQRIMQCAFELFAHQGDKFSLSGISISVGIKKASIYFHFHSKEELIREVIEDEIDEYFFEINQENDSLERVFFRFLDYYESSQTKLLFWKRLLLFPPETLNPDLVTRIREASARRFEVVRGLIAQAAADGVILQTDQDEVEIMFFSLLHGLLSSVLIYRPADMKRHYRGIWNRFWASIAVIPPTEGGKSPDR